MTAEGDADSNVILRNLLESLTGGEDINAQLTGANPESVVQLLAAAFAQAGHTILATGQGSQQLPTHATTATTGGVPEQRGAGVVPAGGREISVSDALSGNFAVNPETSNVTEDATVFDLREAYESVPQASTLEMHDATNVVSTVEVPMSEKPRPLCIKFPIELRKQIISMRKEGKLSKDIAKELKVSVSGVQKVWERFLATGMAHDRRPSTYAGRPRKSTYSQDVYSPGFDLQSPDEVFPASSHMEYMTTPCSATPCSASNDVIITEESDVFTEGATVEIVETTPLTISQPKSPKKRGAPPYRGRLLLKIVEDCPLATMRASSDGLTNPHVQNLMISITRPLYMEYVLGHPFGKVPPSISFDGCTSTEAEVIMSDPVNPVGKKVLAALGYSTKVFFNACCKPSPLFDTDRLLTSLPVSLGPAHLADGMKNVLQLMIDLCTNPEEALNRLPTGPGPLLVARRGEEAVVATHSVPAPGKLSEFWVQLYGHAKLLQCCENFLSAHPPSAPCLLCHPFENFAQSLEIREPEESPFPSSPLTPSQVPRARFTSDLHAHESQEVEVQVLDSGTAGLTSVSTIIPLPRRRGRGRGQKQSKSGESAPQHSFYEEQNVVSDGEFEIPSLSDNQGSEVVVSESDFLRIGSDLETLEQVEATEAAQNLALLASHVTSMASNSHTSTTGTSTSSLEGSMTVVPFTSSTASSDNLSTVATSAEHVPSDIVAIAEVVSTVQELESSTQLTSTGTNSTACTTASRNSTKLASHDDVVTGTLSFSEEIVSELEIVGVATQTELSSESLSLRGNIESSRGGGGGGDDVTRSPPVTNAGSSMESVRRSRRKITRARRFANDNEDTHPHTGQSETSPKKTPSKKKEAEGGSSCRVVRSPVVLLGDVLASPPPAKRTRSQAAVTASCRAETVVEEDNEGGVVSGSGCGNPLGWGVTEVGEFIRGIPQCGGLNEVFIEHLVDGETLLSLDPQMMVKLMDLKTGPALRIHRKISSLKKHFNISN